MENIDDQENSKIYADHDWNMCKNTETDPETNSFMAHAYHFKYIVSPTFSIQ